MKTFPKIDVTPELAALYLKTFELLQKTEGAILSEEVRRQFETAANEIKKKYAPLFGAEVPASDAGPSATTAANSTTSVDRGSGA